MSKGCARRRWGLPDVAAMLALLSVLAGVLLCAWGHDIRDGHPALGTTHGARALGGLACGLGAAALFGASWPALAAWLGVWGGFYTDQKHGEGQANGGFLHDAPYLMLSGVTSWAPVAILLGAALWLTGAHGAALRCAVLPALGGALKVGLWPFSYRVNPADDSKIVGPTRLAAILF